MKIYEGYNDSGELIYFEISNTFLPRKFAVKIIKKIPHVEILQEDKREDTFCIFKIGDKVFEMWEPFGDNSRYHIAEKGALRNSNELEIIKQNFSNHSLDFFALMNK